MLDRLSIPPAIATSTIPITISRAACPIAVMPEQHALSMPTDGKVSGREDRNTI